MRIQFDNGSNKDFYMVRNPIFIIGINLISPDSPLGAALMGKGADSSFSYTSGFQIFSGKIAQIA